MSERLFSHAVAAEATYGSCGKLVGKSEMPHLRLIMRLLLLLPSMIAAVTPSSPARALTERSSVVELEARLRVIQDKFAGVMSTRLVDVAPEGLEYWLADAGAISVVALCLVAGLSAAMALAYSRLAALIAALAGSYGGALLFGRATSGLDKIHVFHDGGALFVYAAGYLLLSGVLPSVLVSLGVVVALDREVREWLVQGGQVSVDGLPSALQATIQAYKSTLPPPARRRLERRGMISCRMLVQLEAKDRAAIERATRRIAAQTENLQRLQAIEEKTARQEMLEGASNLERAVMELRNQARTRIVQLEAEIHALQAENRRLCRAVRPAS